MKSKSLLNIFELTFIFFLILALVRTADSDTGLDVGDKINSFNANDQNGELWKLDNYLGEKYIVFYFYPAALTGGCTKQACGYRDYKSKLTKLNVEVIGISADPVKNLKIFEKMHNLNFTLISDVNGEIAKMFGVPIGKGGSITREVEGKDTALEHSMSISRWTFIIDLEGKVVWKDSDVDAGSDSQNVIDFLTNQ
jgi:peroxiredoxin Q/BCP